MSYIFTFYFFSCAIFFFNDTATTEIYTLSLHDALPIFRRALGSSGDATAVTADGRIYFPALGAHQIGRATSELQSRLHLVCRLLLEKKKKNNQTTAITKSVATQTYTSKINLIVLSI